MALPVSLFPAGGKGTITMQVAAWMPAEVVKANFLKAQQQVLVEGANKESGRPSERGLDVCIFVEENIQNADRGPTWESLWRKWNAEYPDKRYRSYNGFRQAYSRNMPKVLRPYREPNVRISPAAERRAAEAERNVVQLLRSAVDRRHDPSSP
jgi:hypothetical protein